MKELFKNVLLEPLYNALIEIINFLPMWADVGIAVIILTIIVRLILLPLSLKAVRTQVKMKIVQPKLKALQEKYKTNREELGRAMMSLYKEEKLNPFAGIGLILIQIPILLALYWVFVGTGLPAIRTDLLYSFVNIPDTINMNFLGLADMGANKNLILALIAAVSQFFQVKFAMPKPTAPADPDKPTFQEDLARSMSVQMKYIFPVITFFISYTLTAVVGLYWIVSNLFAIGQELYVRKKGIRD